MNRIMNAEQSLSIPTCTGRRVGVVNPAPEDIDIEDIAHGLSHACRFAGHVPAYYSVAQHSLLVSELLGDGMALWGLLHDASEAYLHDITRPLKRAMDVGQESTDRLRYIGAALAYDLADQGLIPQQWCLVVSDTISTAILEDRLARGIPYAELERRMMATICARFGLPTLMPPEVELADNVILATEVRDLCHRTPEDCVSWSGAQPMERRIDPCCPELAKALFLARFEKLASRAGEGK